MKQLVYSDSFLKSLNRMDPSAQDRIKIVMFNLANNLARDQMTPGFHLEKLEANNLYSGRINDNLRLIINIDGDQYVVLYVDKHDDAYRWASNHKLQMNNGTGAMQLVTIERTTEQIFDRKYLPVEPKLFEKYSDAYLLALGVPEEWIPVVKGSTKEQEELLMEELPSEVMVRLLQLEEGQLVPIPRRHDGDPLEHPDSLRHFVTVKAMDSLSAALESPWAQWSVFLHPDQQDLIKRSFSGPTKVSGSSGTGKTVVAVHRAFKLAKENPSSQVLLTTFSRALAFRIRQMVGILSGGTDNIPPNLTIENVHSIALQIWNRNNPGVQFEAAEEKKLEEHLESAMGLKILGPLDLKFILSEWKHVVDYWGLTDLESYLKFPRTGRGTILGQRQREELWSVFGPVLQNLSTSKSEMTWSQLTFSSATLSAKEQSPPYQHLVVDEIQDFGPAEISLIRSLVSPGSNDLFLCGDAAQRIFRRTFSWSRVGIQIQGRSRHLRVNYRNTQQIQSLAETVLSGSAIGGDDDEEDRNAVSLLTGARPIIKVCENEAEEIVHIGEWLEEMTRLGYEQDEIAILSRRTKTLSAIGHEALKMVGSLKRRDLQDSRVPSGDGVAFGTMHGGKGLEFKAVAVIGCGEEEVPDKEKLDSACDESERQEIMDEEKHLLYVALTRPRERLLITCSRNLSLLIKDQSHSD
jgi:superfamily I DNA/RNA helicase/mRNA-degrading endonuclease RelE of RelBE toxin-antitoxin system